LPEIPLGQYIGLGQINAADNPVCWPGKDKSASNGNIGCYPSTEFIS